MEKVKFVFLWILLIIPMWLSAQNIVSNVRVQQSGDEQLIVMYDLAARADVEAYISFDGGRTFRGPLQRVSGAVGRNIAPEKNKMFMWNIISEIGSVDVPSAVVKVVAIASTSSSSPAPAPAPTKNVNRLVAQKRNIYASDERLRKNEVRTIMANTDALRLYNKGISRNRNGNIWVVSGLCITAAGVAIYTIQPFEWREYFHYDDNIYYRYNDEAFNQRIAIYTATTGIAVTLIGAIMKGSSKKFITQSVNSYNSGRGATNVKLDFGLTGNGVKMTFNF